jgi:hypothetical protein
VCRLLFFYFFGLLSWSDGRLFGLCYQTQLTARVGITSRVEQSRDATQFPAFDPRSIGYLFGKADLRIARIVDE